MCLLRVKVTYLLNVLGVDEDLTIDGFELIGAWPKHLRDDVQSLLRRGELVVVLAYLAERRRVMSHASPSWAPSYVPSC